MYMNEMELKIYNKLIKPYLKVVDGKVSIDMDAYQKIESEQVKSLFVSCLYKNNIQMLDNGKRDIIEKISDEANDYFDDFTIMDDLIEEEILPLCKRDVLNDDEGYSLPYIDGEQLDQLYCSNDAKKYIEGLIDGYNFSIRKGLNNNDDDSDKILFIPINVKNSSNKELRDKLLPILEGLNPLEREVIRYKYSELLSNTEIAILLNIPEKKVEYIYKNAIMKIKNNKYTEDLKRYYK